LLPSGWTQEQSVFSTLDDTLGTAFWNKIVLIYIHYDPVNPSIDNKFLAIYRISTTPLIDFHIHNFIYPKNPINPFIMDVTSDVEFVAELLLAILEFAVGLLTNIYTLFAIVLLP
jgi:hypothetical protein